MKENPAPLDLDALLAHSDWVHALARHLLSDDHLADDVAQEAWIAALKKPPRGALTPWLKAVTVNLARKAMRGRLRRGERERRASRPELQTQRFEAHRAVVQAVDALQEPWRTTVVLRYFEDLPPRAIAAQMNVPVATVRTRLRRALGFLRGRLDRDFGGDGKTWTLALVPLLPMTAEGSPIAGVATGVALMAKKATLVLVVLLAALSLVWWVARDDSSSRPGRARGRSTARLPAAAPRGTTSEPMKSAPPRLAPGFATLRARVEAPDAAALRGIRVELVRRQFLGVNMKDGRRIEMTPEVRARATTTAEGAVAIKRPPPDWTGTLYFRAAGHGWRSGNIAVQHTKTTLIVCRPTRTVQVRTHDSEGPTQATVLVSVVDYSRPSRDILEHLHTTEGGLATFEAFPEDRLEVFAINARGCSSAWLGTAPATGPVEPILLSLSNDSKRARLMFGTEPVVAAEAWLDGVRVDHGPSADDGRIVLAPIPDFRLPDIEFRLPWLYHPLLTENITEEPSGARLINLTGFALSRRGVVRVLAPDGAPIQGALVGLQWHVGFQAVGQVVTDASGQAVVHARRKFGSQDGRDIVWRYATNAIVYAEGYAPLIVEVPDGESDVRLNNVAHRTIHVVDTAGAPVPHARVYLSHQLHGDPVGYGIALLADGRGRCRVPALPNWKVRARVFGGGVYVGQSDPIPVGTEASPLRLEISTPSPFAFRVAVRNADGSDVSEPIHLQLTSNGGPSRDTVLARGTWSETAIWKGQFQIRARGLRSGLVAAASVHLSPEAPRQRPIELTLSAPWLIRVRPLGIPHASDSRPWRARGYVGTRAVWRPLSVHESGDDLDVRLPAGGPWTVELSRGAFTQTLSDVSAVQTGKPTPHDVSFTESAILVVDLGEQIRGRPRLMLLPLHDDGAPAAAKPVHKDGSWSGNSATWQLPQGHYHFALIDGKPGGEMWLWATSKAIALLAGQETRLKLSARSIAVLSVVPPGDAPVDWSTLTVHPEEPALAWLADAMRLRIRQTPDGPMVPLWPGSYVVRDSKARDTYRLYVRAGDQKIALVPVR